MIRRRRLRHIKNTWADVFLVYSSERQRIRIYRESYRERRCGKGGEHYSRRVYLAECRKISMRCSRSSRSLSPGRRAVNAWNAAFVDRYVRRETRTRRVCGLKRGNAILTSFLTPLCPVRQKLCVLSRGSWERERERERGRGRGSTPALFKRNATRSLRNEECRANCDEKSLALFSLERLNS